MPPPTTMVSPVINEASLEHRNDTIPLHSSGVPALKREMCIINATSVEQFNKVFIIEFFNVGT